MKGRSKNRKREDDQTHDRRGKINKKTLPLYFFPPINDGRFRVVKDASNCKVAKRTDLRKEKRLQDEQHISLPSSLREYCKDDLFHNARQDKERLKCNGKRNLVKETGVKRPLFLPPLKTRKFPNCKQVDEFATPVATPVKSRDSAQNTFPEDLPKIKTRKSESKDVNPVSTGMKNTEETVANQNLPLLVKRTVKPLRAAISSSATLRGLITLDLEEQFVLRFRLSNYDAKDINIATLNEPV